MFPVYLIQEIKANVNQAICFLGLVLVPIIQNLMNIGRASKSNLRDPPKRLNVFNKGSPANYFTSCCLQKKRNENMFVKGFFVLIFQK